MPAVIPFAPSIANYTMLVTLGVGNAPTQYKFVVHWNARDLAWYLDVLAADETPIYNGIKIVLGSYLGVKCTDPLFRYGAFVAIDTTAQSKDAGFDDLGARVIVKYYTSAELIADRYGTAT